MAAALRHAAKRLGGGVLQRSKSAIVSEEGRRLPTRLLHNPTGATTPEGRKAAERQLIRIQEKKEELYDLVADFERTYKAPMSISWPNCALLHRLSTQIEPRPGDPYWRMLRGGQRQSSFFTVMGIFATAIPLGIGIAYGLVLAKKNYGKEFEDWHSQKKKKLEDWWNKQYGTGMRHGHGVVQAGPMPHGWHGATGVGGVRANLERIGGGTEAACDTACVSGSSRRVSCTSNGCEQCTKTAQPGFGHGAARGRAGSNGSHNAAKRGHEMAPATNERAWPVVS